MSTRAALLRAGAEVLAQAGVADPGRDARLLMRWASGLDAAALNLRLEEAPCADERRRWDDAIARRRAREPLSHITGQRLFWGRPFRVSPAVLDPRPETEVLIAEALHRGPFARVLDLGTGSGCLGLTLLAEWPGAEAVATDLSGKALEVARANAAALGVDARARFIQGAWFEPVAGQFDLIVSNPPYLAAGEIASLSPEVRDHEPHMALSPGGDGLDAYRAIAAGLAAHLAPKGLVMLEIGPTQVQEVSRLVAAAGLAVSAVLPDLDKRPRVVVAQA